MNKIFSLILSLFTFFSLTAQEGAPLLTHFRESRDIENQNWAICQDINNVMLFANRKGILTFDGKDWNSIRIPTIPFSMEKNPDDGKIYVGGENNYGVLVKDDHGFYHYQTLSGDSTELGIITKIIFRDSLAWFYGDKSISRYNIESDKLELRLSPKSVADPFTGMFLTLKNTFVNVMNKGLYRLDSDTLFPIVTGYFTEKTAILFSLPYNENLVLVGLSNGNISLFDGIKYYDYKIDDDGYLKENILSEGIEIGDSLYAFSTLDGGALVINKSEGKIRFTINNQNELPDDEVFAMEMDRNGGLWLSHQYGLTRADLNLPIGNFGIYPGLKGNLTNSLWYNNELYVATSEGVYYLTEVKNYSEVQILVKEETTTQETITQDQGSRKSILSRIFGRKLEKEKNDDLSSDVEPQKTSVQPTVKYTRKTINRLKSVNYRFNKVEGLNEKCRQLVSTENGILAATNKGLYVINSYKAELAVDNHYINFISWLPSENKYWIGSADGYFSIIFQDGKWLSEFIDPDFTDPVYSITKSNEGTLWIGIDNSALVADIGSAPGSVSYKKVTMEIDFPQRYLLDCINDTVFLYTETGVCFYDSGTESFIEHGITKDPSGMVSKFIYPLSNKPWVRQGSDWSYLADIDSIVEKEKSLLKVFSDPISITTDERYFWVIDGENRLFRIDLKKSSKIREESNVFVKSIYDERGTTFNLSKIVFNRGDNIVNFEIVAPGYLKQNTTQYQYNINRLMPDWSPWSVRTTYNLMVPVPGDYTLQVRAKDLWGNVGEPVKVEFTIKAPFTQTTIFYVLLVVIGLILIYLIVRFRERQLHRENQILEEKVRERTAEIEAQKEEITSSIEYASRIQMAMLPEEDNFKTFFPDYFMIFKPRDIVSGDFYWIGESEKSVLFTVADCTGHGVPGAFMSTLGISALNEIIANTDNLKANLILNLLREKIKTSLHQTGREGEATDGMDMAFCIMDKNRKKLQFSGAYNPLFIYQNGVFKEYKGDRMPIGIHYGEKSSFTNYEISITKGDTIYIFSDGISDQFGGPCGSKYKISNLKRLLGRIHKKPMAAQRDIIEKEFEKWKGSSEQVDDITMIGIRF